MAAGATYTPIASYTVTTAQASYTFSSISGAYTDLVLIYSGSITTGAGNGYLRFNGDTASNYSDTYLYGNGSTAGSGRVSGATVLYCFNTSTTQENAIFNVINYSNSTTYKTLLSRANESASLTAAYVGLWRATPAPITSILIATDTSTFVSGTTFSLYGILAA